MQGHNGHIVVDVVTVGPRIGIECANDAARPLQRERAFCPLVAGDKVEMRRQLCVRGSHREITKGTGSAAV